jgi:transposase-like protein
MLSDSLDTLIAGECPDCGSEDTDLQTVDDEGVSFRCDDCDFSWDELFSLSTLATTL